MITETIKDQAEEHIDSLFANLSSKDYTKEEKKEKRFPSTVWNFTIASNSMLEDTSPRQKALHFLSGKSLVVELAVSELYHSMKVCVNGANIIIYSPSSYEKALEIIKEIIGQMLS